MSKKEDVVAAKIAIAALGDVLRERASPNFRNGVGAGVSAAIARHWHGSAIIASLAEAWTMSILDGSLAEEKLIAWAAGR